MGGFGSTRWGNHVKKRTVEDSFQISIRKITHHLRERTRKTMRYGWLSSGQLLGSIHVTLDSRIDRAPTVQLNYCLNGVPKRQNVNLELNTKRNPVNGHWWFHCPTCGRRCGCLYLPESDGTGFLCRMCWPLTYRSAQQHDKRLAEFAPLFKMWRNQDAA